MSEWDSYAADWDDDPAAQAYSAAAYASLEPVVVDASIELDDARVLDFGCGTGLLTEQLVRAGATVTAVDTSPAMLDVLRAKIEMQNLAGVTVAAELPSPPASFDLVVCSSVCSFLDDYPATVASLAALLAPGGVFAQWDWERDDGDDDSHGLSRTEITAALGEAGLLGVTVDVAFEIPYGDDVMRPLIGHARKPT